MTTETLHTALHGAAGPANPHLRLSNVTARARASPHSPQTDARIPAPPAPSRRHECVLGFRRPARAVAAIPMEADTGCRLEVDDVLSFADDLVVVLRRSDDADANAQVIAGAGLLRTACRSESDHLHLQLKGLLHSTPLLLCSHLLSLPVVPCPSSSPLVKSRRVSVQ